MADLLVLFRDLCKIIIFFTIFFYFSLLVVTLSPNIGYLSQINLIIKEKSIGNFSIDVCAILLFANILRICFWFLHFPENNHQKSYFQVWRKVCCYIAFAINNNDLHSGWLKKYDSIIYSFKKQIYLLKTCLQYRIQTPSIIMINYLEETINFLGKKKQVLMRVENSGNGRIFHNTVR